MTMEKVSKPFGLKAYQLATQALSPMAPLILRRRLRRGKEDPDRMQERLGFPSRERPPGPLAWIHGASVGESLSVLPLIDRLLSDFPKLHILMTTGTVTSSSIMEQRLRDRAFHQYVPIDQPAAVRRFLDHWRPNIGLWLEQDLWPNLIRQSAGQDIPLALINARMSDGSFRSWQKWLRTASDLLSYFQILLAQDQEAANKYKTLGAHHTIVTGNLKFAAAPLPHDPVALEDLKSAIGNRPLFLAASTHPKEEEQVVSAASIAKDHYPDLLTIIVPRHPERGEEIAATLTERAIPVQRRSQGDLPTHETDIYLADTLGELGLFYRLADLVFIGGSLIEHGGQNPLEAARLDCCILHGPHTTNFPAIYPEFIEQGASIEVQSSQQLGQTVCRLLAHPEQRTLYKRKATELAAKQDHVLDTTIDALKPVLKTLQSLQSDDAP